MGFNATGVRADGGADLEFDFPYNDLFGPTDPENIEAATVQAFYVINVLHDSLNRYGFDEVAGNMQASNYTASGISGDQIIVSVVDPDSVGNIMPTLDGVSPLMQLGNANNVSIAMDTDVAVSYTHLTLPTKA